MRITKALLFSASSMVLASLPAGAHAQDAKTYGDAFQVPVFEQVDQNGVDLVRGVIRANTPILESGSEQKKSRVGLTWTGKSWTYIDQPTIWRKDGTYTVTYNGSSEEFKSRQDNYAQKKPITGAKLSCSIYEPGNLAAECFYTNRHGDTLHFWGMYSPYTPYVPAYGLASSRYGNLGMSAVESRSGDEGHRVWGSPRTIGGFGGAISEANYYKTDFILRNGNQSLKITTPNHANNSDEHYLRPKSTTQTFTEDNGTQWRYNFDGSRRLTMIDPPGDGGTVTLTYYDNDKVKTLTNAYGTWNYAYTTPGDYGTTTVTNPLGEQIYVKYHRDKGYVTESRDALNRWTYYAYDAGDRLTRVTYPEQNYVQFTYDARGNIYSQLTVPKPGNGATQSQSAGYETGCVNQKTCNRPQYVIDANGNRTDFTYGPVTNGTTMGWNSNVLWPTAFGEGKPIAITSPAPTSGAVRPQVRNEYSGGLLIRSSVCKTLSSCAGTSDEVVTTYNYGGTQGTTNLLYGITVTSTGQTPTSITTCYGYDDQGRRISETPPLAGIASCPTGAAATTASLAPSASAPVAPYAPSAPTFPDGGTGAPPPPDEPVDPPCGFGGIICQ